MFFPTCLALVALSSLQCAYVSADESINVKITDTLPGRNKSPGQQCKERLSSRYAGVCAADDPATRCSDLICTDTERSDIPMPTETGPALDGTWCGDEKICLGGSCVDDTQPPKNILKHKDFQYGCESFW